MSTKKTACAAAGIAISAFVGNAATYYVDCSTGDDSRDKTAAVSRSAPWKTISKAAAVMTEGDTVLIAPGVYREQVVPTYWGNPGRPITYRALDPENRPVVDGSILLDPAGWRDVELTSFRGEKIAAKVHDIDFAPPALFCAGERMTLAHEPEQVNGDDPYELEHMAVISGENTSGSKATLIDSAFFTQTQADYWKGADLLVFYEGSYGNGNVIEESKVASYDPAGHSVTVSPAFGSSFPAFHIEAGDRWCLRNHIKILDKPGEFYVDTTVSPYQLYVVPLAGHTASEVSAVKFDYGFDASWKPYQTLDGIEFIAQAKAGVFSQYGSQNGRGLVVTNCFVSHELGDGIHINATYDAKVVDTTAKLCTNEGITFGSGYNFTVLNCTVCSNGNNGIWFGSGPNDKYYATSNVLVRGCLIYDQGGRRYHADNFQMQQCDNVEISCCRLSQSQNFQNGWCQYTGHLVFTNNVVEGGPFGFGAVRFADISNNLFDRAALRFDSHLDDAPISDKTYYLPVSVGISNNVVRGSACWWTWHWSSSYRGKASAFSVDANYYVPVSPADDGSRIDSWDATRGVGYGADSVVASSPDADVSASAVAALFAPKGLSVGPDPELVPELERGGLANGYVYEGVVVPLDWLTAHVPGWKALGSDSARDAALGAVSAAHAPRSIFACYVIGLDPAVEGAYRDFAITSFTPPANSGAAPRVTYAPDLGAARRYTLQGAADPKGPFGAVDANSRFFRVLVEIP